MQIVRAWEFARGPEKVAARAAEVNGTVRALRAGLLQLRLRLIPSGPLRGLPYPSRLRPPACALRLQTTVCGLRPERRAWRAVSRRPAHQSPTSPSHSLSSSPLPYLDRCGDKRPRSRATRQPLRVCHVLLQPQGTMRASRGCPGDPWARNSANGKAKRARFDICCNGEPDDKPGSESSAQVGVKPLEVLR